MRQTTWAKFHTSQMMELADEDAKAAIVTGFKGGAEVAPLLETMSLRKSNENSGIEEYSIWN